MLVAYIVGKMWDDPISAVSVDSITGDITTEGITRAEYGRLFLRGDENWYGNYSMGYVKKEFLNELRSACSYTNADPYLVTIISTAYSESCDNINKLIAAIKLSMKKTEKRKAKEDVLTYAYESILSDEAQACFMPARKGYDIRNNCFVIELPYRSTMYTRQQAFDLLRAHKQELSKYCRKYCAYNANLMKKIGSLNYYSISYTVLPHGTIEVKFNLRDEVFNALKED